MTTLCLVSIPIGNLQDISLRALEVLKSSDLIIGEEWKTTSKFLKYYQIQKDFAILNEHTTENEIQNLFQKIQSLHQVSLISDAGTPLVEDPGHVLLNKCIQNNFIIKAIPGANAFLTALVLSGFEISPFTFFGFLPRDKNERKKILQKQLQYKHTLVWYETPYRYKSVIYDLAQLVSKDKKIFLALNLTMDSEIQFRGKISDLLNQLDSFPKAEPVIILDNH